MQALRTDGLYAALVNIHRTRRSRPTSSEQPLHQLQYLYPGISPRHDTPPPLPTHQPYLSSQHQHHSRKTLRTRLVTTYMRIGSIARPKLSGPLRCEATLGVAASAREATSAGSEDGGFAGRERAGWNEKDEFELLKCAHFGLRSRIEQRLRSWWSEVMEEQRLATLWLGEGSGCTCSFEMC